MNFNNVDYSDNFVALSRKGLDLDFSRKVLFGIWEALSRRDVALQKTLSPEKWREHLFREGERGLTQALCSDQWYLFSFMVEEEVRRVVASFLSEYKSPLF